MRAAVIQRYGELPVMAERQVPHRSPGTAILDVTAAPLNPADLAIASGKFYAGSPAVPYVPGREGVGRVVESSVLKAGTRVYFESSGGNGSLAQRTVVDEGRVASIEVDVEDTQAAALGIPGLTAWIGLQQRVALRPGETVLVLGASGTLGLIAVQAARLLGAVRVIAAARDQDRLRRARELGADATVDLSLVEGLAEAFREAAEGVINVVVDPLWGTPAVAALQAMAKGGRLLQVGQSAGAEAPVPSAAIRGKSLSILGLTNFDVPWPQRVTAYRQLLEHAAAGRLTVDVDTMPLEELPRAWRLQRDGAHRKLVLTP